MMNTFELDATDELATFADEFARPPGVYMDGNSLGLMCRSANETLLEAIESWRTRGIRGWTEGQEPWFGMPRRASSLLAPLIGCEAEDVLVGASTTVNLHQILASFADPRRDLLIDASHFPTDRYAVESYLRTSSPGVASLQIVTPGANRFLDESEVISRFSGVGFAVLPSVVYTTGQLLDLKRVTAAARECSVLVAWDCSHSVGVVPHRFRIEEIDLAFGCGYKYLNGGPGASAWLYVHPRLRDRLPGLAGWFGCDPARQFEMSAEFYPANDAGRFQIATPHVFSLAPLIGSLQLLNRAGIDRIRTKSLAQTQFIIDQARDRLSRFGVGIVTPLENSRRGGHVALTHSEAAKLSRALRMAGVVPDFRPPDMLRFAPAPLYTSFRECEQAIDSLHQILSRNTHLELPETDELVT